ncbi:caspase family protein [Solwaraspora sp. WMMD406]|uniref:caspase family protein n=1 Tax=Solwaraspora sp. WMMD406 TaxID=3016095 RepID=UPI0024171485|nr:caspase family protein [Solwaraspora sp. WMMD406]MDG4762878.1 caspase family protein [Solwaraspora sp. WMMD406]
MTRKALLIGAQTNGLSGVLNDVTAMGLALAQRGFLIDRLVTPDATRERILDAYEKLITDARPDDAVVVYFSGHGGRLLAPDGAELQFIVPDDYDDSTEDDFRGVTGVEQSLLLKRLTDVTHNVTVIHDCCHAAHMSRRDARVRALIRSAPERWRPTYDTVRRYIDRQAADGLPVHQRPLIANPHAVRVVACAPWESAYETANRESVQMGLFTDALTRAIRDSVGLRINWSTLLTTVRGEVQNFEPAQRPEVQGPTSRQPFETTDLDLVDSLSVVATGPERIELLGAPLLGVGVGDKFAIMPNSADGPQDGPALGTATVDRLLPTMASAQLRLAADRSLPADARAYRTHAAAPALPVRLPADDAVAAKLRDAMSLWTLLRPADPATDVTAAVEVVVDTDHKLVVRDENGPLHEPYPATPLGIISITDNLQRIAQATALRRLQGDPDRPLRHGVVIEWGRVRDGEPDPLSRAGELLFAYEGERIYVRLRNEGEHTAYVSLIDVGISSRVTVLTAADHGGVRLLPGASYTYGWDHDRQRLTGVDVTWPESIVPAAVRPETVLALISDKPVDVGVLRQQGVRDVPRRFDDTSNLGRLLQQIATGASREVGAAPVSDVRFDVVPIDFMVSPTVPPTVEEPTFRVDDRPGQQVRLLSARSLTPTRVAVRIDELIVHRNRAFGNADIRVDAVVLTGGTGGTGGTGQELTYRAETIRCSRIADGERLPLDNVLIYHGPAVDYLDIAVWVSRDTAGSLALGDLLQEKLTSPLVQAAGAELVGLAVAAPQAAAAVAAVGAGAVLVNTAYELLTKAVGSNIGLYRTSLLAQEQYGIGRHVRHPQDFTFTFSIDEVA